MQQSDSSVIDCHEGSPTLPTHYTHVGFWVVVFSDVVARSKSQDGLILVGAVEASATLANVAVVLCMHHARSSYVPQNYPVL